MEGGGQAEAQVTLLWPTSSSGLYYRFLTKLAICMGLYRPY